MIVVIKGICLAVGVLLAKECGTQRERKHYIWSTVWMYLAVLFVCFAFAPSKSVHAAELPAAAKGWQRTLTRESRAVWGLDAPVAMFASQIQTESGWNPKAHSPYADGLAQFTATTAADMARWYPELGPADPYNPGWAMRALVRYDRRLYLGIDATATDCDHWAMTLSAYNGGAGWLARDRAQCSRVTGCDPSRWWGQVETQTQRAAWARAENRAYPERIMRTWLPVYGATWGNNVVCL